MEDYDEINNPMDRAMTYFRFDSLEGNFHKVVHCDIKFPCPKPRFFKTRKDLIEHYAAIHEAEGQSIEEKNASKEARKEAVAVLEKSGEINTNRKPYLLQEHLNYLRKLELKGNLTMNIVDHFLKLSLETY